MLDYFESQDIPDDGGPVTYRCFHLHRHLVDEHVGVRMLIHRVPPAPQTSLMLHARRVRQSPARALSWVRMRFLHSLQLSPLIAP
jgi:hypothetical protein